MQPPRWLADHQALSRAYLACKTEACTILRQHIQAAQAEVQRKVPADQAEREMTP
jgi:hypothetical protein